MSKSFLTKGGRFEAPAKQNTQDGHVKSDRWLFVFQRGENWGGDSFDPQADLKLEGATLEGVSMTFTQGKYYLKVHFRKEMTMDEAKLHFIEKCSVREYGDVWMTIHDSVLTCFDDASQRAFCVHCFAPYPAV